MNPRQRLLTNGAHIVTRTPSAAAERSSDTITNPNARRHTFSTLSGAIDHATAQLEASDHPLVRRAWNVVLKALERDIDDTASRVEP